MSKIVGIIQPQNYEVIRNKVAEIIAIELEQQFLISYDPDFDCNVWLERTTPFDLEEMTPAVINVSFVDGNYQNEDVKDADGVYSYAVDVYARAYTNAENIGDTRAALIVQKVIGKIRAILMATVYKTVDTGLGIVKNRKVVSVQVYDPKRPPNGDDSTTFDQAGRLLFQVTAIETVEVITPNMIQGADTWVRWCCTDKGYVWINDGQTNGNPGNPNVCPPIPPSPPLGPYLREVSVDGVTITGNGTPLNPLVAIGGGGGNSILLQTDGVNNGSQNILNLKQGSNINIVDDGNGGVTVSASGGGLPQVNSDWNATSGVAEILNKPTIPILPATIVEDVTATLPIASSGGSTPDISITQADTTTDGYLSSTDWNTFNDKFDVPTGTNADYLDGTGAPITFPTIPAAQIQSDWNQTNNALLDFIKNKPTIPTNGLPAGGTAGQILTKVDATDYNATWQENYADWTSVVKHIVKNNGLSGTITKGTAVYVTGSNGTNMLVGRASNTSEATSSKTMGLMQSDITTTGGTQTGFVITEGLLSGLNTAGQTAGDPVWLGVNGALIYGLINKPYAPAHLVFIGIVTKISAGNGEIFVKIQNGFELKEIHDVDIITTTPINGHILGFDGTLWVNKTVATWLGFTPVTNARTIGTTAPLSGGGDLTADRTLSIADAAADGSTKGAAAFTAADFNAASGVISIDYTNGQAASSVNKGFLTAADWTTFNNKGGGSTFKSVIDTTPVNLSILNTKVFAQLVPANTFAIGDIIQIKARLSKVGVAGLMTLRVYVNTADSLLVPAATLISTTVTATNAQLNFAIDKSAAIKSATVTQTQTATNSGLYQDPQTATTALTNSNIDWTVNQYIIFAIQNAAAGDSTVMTNFQIIKL